MTLPNITLRAATNLVAGTPVTFGHTFIQGDLPASKQLAATFNNTAFPVQTDVKATWPADGSARHAIISMLVPTGVTGTTANVSFALADAVTPPNSGTVASNLIAGGYNVSVEVAISGGPTVTVSANAALSGAIGSGTATPPAGALIIPDTYATLAAAIAAASSGDTIHIRSGTHQFVGSVPAGKALTIQGDGAYATIIDGRGGVGAGFSLANGKGGIQFLADGCTVRNIGFINCGGGDATGDGEAGVYGEQEGALTVENCAFDGNENGIFCQAKASNSLIIRNCDFGRNNPNGVSLDDRSHDIYASPSSLTVQNCRHYNATNGHALKSRSKTVTTSGNWYWLNRGRAHDFPDGFTTASTSTGDTFITLPTSASSGLIAYAGESTSNGTATLSYVNPIFRIGRAFSVIWNNAAAATVSFSGATITYWTETGSNPPSLTTQGPGAISGLVVPAVVMGSAPPVATTPLLTASSIATWINGTIATEFRVKAAITEDLLAVFDIRAYANGNTRTDCIVNNDWMNVTPGGLTQPRNDLVYTVTIRRGTTAVHTHSGVAHHKNSRWRRTVWTTTPQTVDVVRSTAYLSASRAVAPYDQTITINEAAIAQRYSQLTSAGTAPFTDHTVTKYMPSTGMRDDIGLLPWWGAVLLLSWDSRVLEIVLRNGDASGYVPWHLRSSVTQIQPTIDAHPNISLLWTNGGGSDAFVGGAYWEEVGGWTPDNAHLPTLAYLPYLLTGDQWHLDNMHDEAGYCLMKTNYNWRGGSYGEMMEYQVRGQAWSMRTLGTAAWITPDDHPLKAYLDNKLSNNFSSYILVYVTERRYQGCGEVEGWLHGPAREPGSMQPWTDDFFIIVSSQLYRMGHTNLASFLAWKVNWTAGRFLNTYFRFEATNYYLMVRNGEGGPFYTTWAAVKDATIAYSKEPARTGLADVYAGGYADVARGALRMFANVNTDNRITQALTWVEGQTVGILPGRKDFPNFSFGVEVLPPPPGPDPEPEPDPTPDPTPDPGPPEPPGGFTYGNVCPFVEWNHISFGDNLITMTPRSGRQNAVSRQLNSPFIKSASPTATTRGVVPVAHTVSCECRVSGDAAGRARIGIYGWDKLNGINESAVSQTVIGAAGTGEWMQLSVTFTFVPHNSPKLPDAQTFSVKADHNGRGTAQFRNFKVRIEPT